MPSPKAQKPRSVWGRAFFNQVNLILLGGAALFALTTFSWIPLLVGAGAEVLWLVLGADSSLFRRWVKIQEDKERQAEIARRAAEALRSLAPSYLDRFQKLQEVAEEIRR